MGDNNIVGVASRAPARARRRHQAATRRAETATGPTDVELRIDTLVLPARGDGYDVRQAVDAGLREGLAGGLAGGLPRSALRPAVTRVLGDPLPADAAAVGATVASEVIRAVLA